MKNHTPAKLPGAPKPSSLFHSLNIQRLHPSARKNCFIVTSFGFYHTQQQWQKEEERFGIHIWNFIRFSFERSGTKRIVSAKLTYFLKLLVWRKVALRRWWDLFLSKSLTSLKTSIQTYFTPTRLRMQHDDCFLFRSLLLLLFSSTSLKFSLFFLAQIIFTWFQTRLIF